MPLKCKSEWKLVEAACVYMGYVINYSKDKAKIFNS